MSQEDAVRNGPGTVTTDAVGGQVKAAGQTGQSGVGNEPAEGPGIRIDASQPADDDMNANQDAPKAVLEGRWLLAARVGWIAVATLALGLASAGVVVALDRPDLIRAPSVRATLAQAGLSNQVTMVVALVLPLAAVVAIGLLIFWRRSNDGAAMLVALMLVLSCAIPMRTEWALDQVVPWLQLPIRFLWVLAMLPWLIFLFVFPDGRFVPRWTRLLGAAAIPAALVVDVSHEQSTTSLGLTVLIWSLFWGIGLYAQAYRYRHVSGPMQRQQTKWVALAVSLLLLFLLLGIFMPTLFLGPANPWSVWALAALLPLMLLFPASIAIAILRHHLYDIDRLLSRTLAYGLLSVVLGIVYAGAVVVLGQVLNRQGGDSSLAVAASTLLVAGLFRPLRRRIQDLVDRRFNRRRYDAAKTIEAFATRLREQLDLEALSAELLGVVDQTIQPTKASLWFRPATSAPQGQGDVGHRPAARPTRAWRSGRRVHETGSVEQGSS
jgi:hypothetical protein